MSLELQWRHVVGRMVNSPIVEPVSVVECRPFENVRRRALRRHATAGWHHVFNILTRSWWATLNGEYELAAKLAGAHQALQLKTREHARFIDSPPEIQWEIDHRANILEALGSDQAQRLISIGRALPFDQVIDLALGRTKHIR